ncbi:MULTISPECIES: hypothetical protein [Acinetobacter]|nr:MULTISPECIES: hypothetical protein [Acinetobacter]
MAKILALKRAGKQDHVDLSKQLHQARWYAAVVERWIIFWYSARTQS